MTTQRMASGCYRTFLDPVTLYNGDRFRLVLEHDRKQLLRDLIIQKCATDHLGYEEWMEVPRHYNAYGLVKAELVRATLFRLCVLEGRVT